LPARAALPITLISAFIAIAAFLVRIITGLAALCSAFLGAMPFSSTLFIF
jgi:hypothetical protein